MYLGCKMRCSVVACETVFTRQGVASRVPNMEVPETVVNRSAGACCGRLDCRGLGPDRRVISLCPAVNKGLSYTRLTVVVLDPTPPRSKFRPQPGNATLRRDGETAKDEKRPSVLPAARA